MKGSFAQWPTSQVAGMCPILSVLQPCMRERDCAPALADPGDRKQPFNLNNISSARCVCDSRRAQGGHDLSTVSPWFGSTHRDCPFNCLVQAVDHSNANKGWRHGHLPLHDAMCCTATGTGTGGHVISLLPVVPVWGRSVLKQGCTMMQVSYPAPHCSHNREQSEETARLPWLPCFFAPQTVLRCAPAVMTTQGCTRVPPQK